MGKQYEKKITWTIKNFSSLQSTEICSDHFVVGGCKWLLKAYPKGCRVDNHLSLYLCVADHGSLPPGWRRNVGYLLTIVNQNLEKSVELLEIQHWYDEKATGWGLASMLPHDKLHASDGGFLVNNQLKIVAEVKVLEVIGKIDVTEETSTLTETMDANGFQLLPSEAKSVSRMFERHPEIASEFLPKNPTLKTGYMSFLLSLIDTMCQSPHELSKDDLSSASSAVRYMTHEGFKLDWLMKKLDEVSEKKEYEEGIANGLKGMEDELKDLKLKCSDMEALMEEEKKKVSSTKAPLSFDDVV